MGPSVASEPLNFFIIVIYDDLCIGYRSYITIIKWERVQRVNHLITIK